MNARQKNDRKTKSSRSRKRRSAHKQSNSLNFETLESRRLLAAITVGNNTDILSPTADTSSVAALIASDGGDGISLREAITATNNTVGEDTITFDSSVFTGGENSLVRLASQFNARTQLRITDSLIVDGSSVGGVVITGDVNGDDITVLGSFVTDVLASRNFSSGSLLSDNDSIASVRYSANLTLTELTLTGGDTSGDGGAIDFDSRGTLTLNQSTVTGNRASDSGGGIYTEDGSIVLNNSTVSDNKSYDSSFGGGGVHAKYGDVSLVNSTVSGNSSVAEGGGIYTRSGNVSVTNSTVSNNSSVSDSQGDGGGIRTQSGLVSLINSTVSGNTAMGRGGGVSVGLFDGDVSLVNSTVSGNTAAIGGGLSVTSATLVNSTVTSNSVSYIGGGISVYSELTLHNSIVAGNTDDGTGPDVSPGVGVFGGLTIIDSVVEFSLIGDTTGSSITATTGTGNILNQPALLAPLSDNGGSTLTHALAPGSLAIDGGSDVLANDAGLTTDQRGEDRFAAGTVDIGAVEQGDLQNNLLLFVTQLTDENDLSDLDINTADFDDLSLREAIGIANGTPGSGTVFFDLPGPDGLQQVITVDSQLTITSSIILNGLGADLLIIDAQGGGDNVLNGNGFRIFEVSDGDANNSIDVSISDLTLTGGDNSESGGAISNFENLTLGGVSIIDNLASFGGGVSNESRGSLTVINSTIANNEASQDGGGISNSGDLAAINVTVSGNSAAGNGGAIVAAGGTLKLTHSTVTNNTGNGGVHFESNVNPTNATFNNTIIDESITGTDANGSTLVGSYNLFSSDDSGVLGTGNLTNLDPLLGPLADNGGPTLTHALLSGSPAVNSGSSPLSVDGSGIFLSTDQRGETRLRFGAVDIGAIETEFEETRSLVVNINTDIEDSFDGLTSLREAIAFANDSTAGVNGDGDADGDGLESDTISFDESVFTGGNESLIRLLEGQLVVDSTVTIDGSSVGGVVITGDTDGDDITIAGTYLTDVSASFGGISGATDDLLDDNSLVFRLFGSTNDLTLTNLTVTGGDGGIRYSAFGDQSNRLTLNQSTVIGNSTESAGGGIHFAGNVFLNGSVVSENNSGDDGGGVYSLGDVYLADSSVSGNGSVSGGGIFARGVVSLTGSTVSENRSSRYGGGIRSGGAVLTDSQVVGNNAGFDENGVPERFSNGGGISTFFDGSVSLTDSTVIGNTSGDNGGGIHADGDVSLTNSTVSGNVGRGDGGGINGLANATIINSTVSGNISGGDGGGLRFRTYSFPATNNVVTSLINSTVSGNSSAGDGGGASFYGVSLVLVNSTVTENVASGMGGGIGFRDNSSISDESFTLHNSIVAGNTDGGTAPDVEVDANLLDVFAVEHSLIGDTTGTGVTAATGVGNILNQLPLLGALADNGGPTQTHNLLSGSPAINAGSNAIANAAGVTVDQRGEERILSTTVDIGGVEVDFAARFVVTTDQDIEDQTDGLTSLREAIAFANENDAIDTIIFDPIVFETETTINISSQLPTITNSLTITGLGANWLTIDAHGGGDNVLDGDGFRIFEVNNGDANSSIDVSISGLTLAGGDTNDFGGAISNFENLFLDSVSIVDSRAQFGGGVSNDQLGALTITNSTIANNEASQDGGGVFTRGALTATNVTISGNSAADNGGAIVAAGDSLGGMLNLTHVTLTNNPGSEGVHFDNANGPTFATFNNTIVDDSIDGVGNGGSTLAGGYNLFTSSDPGITGSGNLFSQAAGLGPLADNGGSTLTHALLFGSPAFNAGSALAASSNGNQLIFDQRGQRRIQFGAVDIGAVESEFETTRSLVVSTAADVIDPNDGFTSLREAIAFADDLNAGVLSDGDADSDGFAEDTITFDASVFTGGENNLIRLIQGELVITGSLVIDASSVAGVVITGDANDDDITIEGTHITDVSASFGETIGASDDLLDDNSRVINFTARVGDLTLTDLTITGGRWNTSGNLLDGGGIRFGDVSRFAGTLTLNQSTVSGNSIVGGGGDGGGIFVGDEGNVSLINSIVSGNSSGGLGGGIRADEGNVSLINSTVSANSSGGPGGGIRTFGGDVTFTNSTVSANTSNSTGGGVDTSSGDVSLTNSTVSENKSGSDGGGIRTFGGDVSLTNSTVNGNISGRDGGGIRTSFGDVSLTNSTASGNSSDDDGGGITANAILLLNSTLTGNSAVGEGGGIYSVPSGGRLTIHNSIVAGNTANELAPDVKAAGSLVLVEHSLIGDITGSGIRFATGAGNFLNQMPLLGPLADNGGLTQTHALLSGSPAINGGSNAIANAVGLTIDQRGEDRVQFGSVDIGAFESGFNERTLAVTTAQDVEDQSDGFTSLREAIVLANEGSGVYTVIFDADLFDVDSTIAIASQLPTITRDLTIVGPSANLLTIDALGIDGVLDGNGFRIFEVNDGDSNNSIDVSISGLTLTGGDTSESGGAVDNFENLVLDGVAIVGNRANFGGGVSNALSGALTITNSTIAGNKAADNGGGIFTRGELNATNVTISGNSAVGSGSAIATSGDSSGATVNLTQSTIYSNVGNGIHFNSASGSTLATFHNSIIDGSIVGVGINGTTLAGGYNLFTSADPGVIGTGNLFNQTAMLDPLSDNGGSTLTHALQVGSPAINAGNNALSLDRAGNPLTTDQRGEDRIFDGVVDIGAYEYQVDFPFLLGDANQDGAVNFRDISPFISLLSANAFLDEADINRDGRVNFLDISPFISLLSSGDSTPLLGGASQDVEVDFLGDSPFVALLSTDGFLNEAEIDRGGGVTSLDISPSTSLSSSVGSPRSDLSDSTGTPLTSKAIIVESSGNADVSLIAAAASEPLHPVVSAAEVPVAIESSLAEDLGPEAGVVNEMVDATAPHPPAPLVPVDDLLDSPVTQVSRIPALNVAITGITTGSMDVSSEASPFFKYNFQEARESRLRGAEPRTPSAQQLLSVLTVEDLGFVHDERDGVPAAILSTEEYHSVTDEFFDTSLESLDEVFDIDFQGPF